HVVQCVVGIPVVAPGIAGGGVAIGVVAVAHPAGLARLVRPASRAVAIRAVVVATQPTLAGQVADAVVGVALAAAAQRPAAQPIAIIVAEALAVGGVEIVRD